MSDPKYPSVVIPLPAEDGGGYMAMALDLQGCVADGDTQAEALSNLADAISEWMEAAREDSREIPAPFSKSSGVDKLRALINAQQKLIDAQAQQIAGQRHSIVALQDEVLRLSLASDAMFIEDMTNRWELRAVGATMVRMISPAGVH